MVGWNIGPAVPEFNGYRMIGAGDGQAGGVLPLSEEMRQGGAKPTWLGYIGVDDVDQTVAAIEAAGGKVHAPAWDIPGIGRLAMVADPQGIPFYVMRGTSEEESTAFAPNRVGHCSWNELLTTDLEGAKEFYTSLFGWTLGDAMPMGPEGGDYQFINQGDQMIGAMFAPQGGQAAWRFCFRVESLEKSIEAVRNGGGEVVRGPMDVPNGGRIILANDPEGAFFMVVEGGQV